MKSDNTVIKVSAAVIITAGKVLLTSRKFPESDEIFWEFPGGKVEAGETLAQALHREIIEELGAEVIVLDLMRNIRFDYPGKSVDLYFIRCLFAAAEPRLHPHDNQQIRQVPLDRLEQINLLPADLPLAEQLKRML
jgi:8-oxo-dGTP diphosphatase